MTASAITMIATAPPLLTATHVSVTRGGRAVLRDLSLSLFPGEVAALLGPNGAGKSTLLDVIGGGIRPTTGDIVSTSRVATVRQSPDLARRSVRANVELALAWWGVPRAERPGRACEALERLKIGHLAQRPSVSLSGGERRRVHLARGLALGADLLLLDEPFAGIDTETRIALLRDLRLALSELHTAVVIVVHDRADAWALAARLLVMMNGRIVADGQPDELLNTPPTPEVARFLGYTGELTSAEGRLLTRTSQVHVDPSGDIGVRVIDVVPTEAGARLTLAAPGGELIADTTQPAPAPGSLITIRIAGGVRFPPDK